MNKDELAKLVQLAKDNRRKIDDENKVKFEKAQAEEYAMLGDKAKPYIDLLIEEIKQGSIYGQTSYRIIGLPKNDAYVEGSFDSGTQRAIVHKNTVTAKVMEIVMGFGSCHYAWTQHGKEYEVFILVNL